MRFGPPIEPMMEKLLRQRFVDEDGCWIWTGGKATHGGYGKTGAGGIGGATLLVHRVAYEIFEGPVPEGQKVLHKCDKPACFRPSCLFAGSQQDNMVDMINKGRNRSSARPGEARNKLTTENVRSILHDDRSTVAIATQHGIHRTTVSHIKNGRRWSHIHREETNAA